MLGRFNLLFCGILMISFFCFKVILAQPIGSDVHGQKSEKLISFVPSDIEQVALDSDINNAKMSFKNSGFYGSLLPYIAVRQDDASICNDSTCKKSSDEFLMLRYLAEGRCSSNSFKKGFSQLCASLRDNRCDTLQGSDRDFCEALRDKNIDLLSKMPGMKGDVSNKRRVASQIMAVYYGYKNYSFVPCESYMQEGGAHLKDQLACAILFSPDLDNTMQRIENDFALLSVAVNNGNHDLCNKIQTSRIKAACKNYSSNNLKDIWK